MDEQALKKTLATRLLPTSREPARFPLYHYTDAAGALGILQSKRIRATDTRFLNDTEELQRGVAAVDEVADQLVAEAQSEPERYFMGRFREFHSKASLARLGPPVFVASFSEDGDSLGQWRAYGSDGAGYAIGIGDLHLPNEPLGEPNPDIRLGVMLIRCEYGVDVFKELARRLFKECYAELRDVLLRIDRSGMDAETLNRLVSAGEREALECTMVRAAILVPGLKHHAFKEEREWRLVAVPRLSHSPLFRASPRGIVPYVEIPLDEGGTFSLASVCVGPTLHKEASLAAIQECLLSLKVSPDLAKSSAVPYRV